MARNYYPIPIPPAQTPFLTGACGKTSLLCSFALGEFPKEYVSAARHADQRAPHEHLPAIAT